MSLTTEQVKAGIDLYNKLYGFEDILEGITGVRLSESCKPEEVQDHIVGTAEQLRAIAIAFFQEMRKEEVSEYSFSVIICDLNALPDDRYLKWLQKLKFSFAHSNPLVVPICKRVILHQTGAVLHSIPFSMETKLVENNPVIPPYLSPYHYDVLYPSERKYKLNRYEKLNPEFHDLQEDLTNLFLKAAIPDATDDQSWSIYDLPRIAYREFLHVGHILFPLNLQQ